MCVMYTVRWRKREGESATEKRGEVNSLEMTRLSLSSRSLFSLSLSFAALPPQVPARSHWVLLSIPLSFAAFSLFLWK